MGCNSSAELWVGLPYDEFEFQQWVYDEYEIAEDEQTLDIIYDHFQGFGGDISKRLDYSTSYDSEEDDDRIIGIRLQSVEWGNALVDLSLSIEAVDAMRKLCTKPDEVRLHLVSSYF